MSLTEIRCPAPYGYNEPRHSSPSLRAPAAADVGAPAVGKEVALDWFTFFCANLQTGFGPFITVYLTAQKWTQTDIGVVLMIGGLVGLMCQMPGGLLVDRVRSKTSVAGLAVAAIGAAALMTATGSAYALILLAWVLHASATCVLTPSITSLLVSEGFEVPRNARLAQLRS